MAWGLVSRDVWSPPGPSPCSYVVIMKFDTLAHMNAWLVSQDRAWLVEEGSHLTSGTWGIEPEIQAGKLVPLSLPPPPPLSADNKPSTQPSMLKVAFLIQINVSVRSALLFALYGVVWYCIALYCVM